MRRVLRLYGPISWVGAAIFTVVWVQSNPGDLPLALAVWSGGVLSVLVPQDVALILDRRRAERIAEVIRLQASTPHLDPRDDRE